MINNIDTLKARPDVEKSEVTRRRDGNTVIIELWHDQEGLQYLFECSVEGNVSEREMLERGREEALAVRETTVKGPSHKKLSNEYPEIVERLKEQAKEMNDYEYHI